MIEHVKQKLRFSKYLGLGIAAIEWYDCAICMSLTDIISGIFFPKFDALTRLLLYFSSFAIGYLGRPLGAFLFGLYSDKRSRLKSAYLAFILMIFSSLFVSLIPTYQMIGIAAPIAFVVLRFIQGIAIGGNYGVSVFSVENAHRSERYFASSMICVGFMVGFLLGSISTAIFNYIFSQQFLESIGWRITLWTSFIVSMPILIVFPRIIKENEQINEDAEKKIDQKQIKKSRSDIDNQQDEKAQPKHISEYDEEKRVSKNLIANIACMLLIDMVPFYLFFVFLPSYRTMVLNTSAITVWLCQALAMSIMIVATPFFGKLADAYGAIKNLKKTALSLVVIGLFVPWNHWIWFAVFGVVMASCYGCLYGVVALAFPKHIRARASSLTLNTTAAICGGATPIVCTYLCKQNVQMLGGFLIAIGLISWIAANALEKNNLDL